jgi:hypothetical protein
MSSLPFKLLALVLVPLSRRHRRPMPRHASTTTVTSETAYGPQYRGTNLVRPGPLYFSGVYLGDDPDPNIRFQILRDITGRFGGDSN